MTQRVRLRILGLVLAVLTIVTVAVGVMLTTGSGELTGTGVDGAGAPVEGCGIMPSGPTFHGREFGVRSDYDGRWSFGEVRNGPYVVRVACAEARAEGSSSWTLVRGDAAVPVVVQSFVAAG